MKTWKPGAIQPGLEIDMLEPQSKKGTFQWMSSWLSDSFLEKWLMITERGNQHLAIGTNVAFFHRRIYSLWFIQYCPLLAVKLEFLYFVDKRWWTTLVHKISNLRGMDCYSLPCSRNKQRRTLVKYGKKERKKKEQYACFSTSQNKKLSLFYGHVYSVVPLFSVWRCCCISLR